MNLGQLNFLTNRDRGYEIPLKLNFVDFDEVRIKVKDIPAEVDEIVIKLN